MKTRSARTANGVNEAADKASNVVEVEKIIELPKELKVNKPRRKSVKEGTSLELKQ
jgi:hypothetical protein